MRFVYLVCICFSLLLAEECQFDDSVLDGIAQMEGHPKRSFGYPYIISFNHKSDILKLTVDDRWVPIDSRTIDCLDFDRCIAVYDEIRDLGITNIDLGAYQINPKFWKLKPEEYFIFSKSRQKACEILSDLKKQYGWSWETIAKYHSSKKENNLVYQKKLKNIARNIQKEQEIEKISKPKKLYNIKVALSED
ncbi:hypothetical protein CQA54_06930 [Helicobacter equorum]|uniref:Transglycosylase SLT domain-containing protein n=1 Tax=Helicobacter equorum TaxID=361872 RepID=A0A3D8INE6_9HELI|nr:hypothetical protein CQA54_06930 [Helicobacter equorum]